MIVHQQLAALAGGKSSKKLLGTDLPSVPLEEGDPTFNPNHPNASGGARKRKKSKKVKTDPLKTKKPVVPQTTPAKKPASK